MDIAFAVIFSWEATNVMDNYFMIDKPETQTNSVAVSQFERFDGQKMKKFVHDELCAVLPRAKKRLI
jgi:hypothetical protein